MQKDKICPSCMEPVHEQENTCPKCGWKFPITQEKPTKTQSGTAKNEVKTDLQLEDRQNDEDLSKFTEKTSLERSKSLNLGICVDRTGSSEQLQRGIFSYCQQIFEEIESKFDKINCYMQSHGDLDYREPIILYTDGDSPHQTLDDITRLTFEGGGDLHETHLDAIEHMLKILPPSQSDQNTVSALVVFCTSETKPAKSGISAEELSAEVKLLGIFLFLVCELTPTFHKLSKSARGFMLPISCNPSTEDIGIISTHISTILTQL